MTFEVPPAAPLWVVRLVARLFLFALRQPEESLPCDREAEKGRGEKQWSRRSPATRAVQPDVMQVLGSVQRGRGA